MGGSGNSSAFMQTFLTLGVEVSLETAKTITARKARLAEIEQLIDLQYGEELRRLKAEEQQLTDRVVNIVVRCSQVSGKPQGLQPWEIRHLKIKGGFVYLVYAQFVQKYGFYEDFGFFGNLKFPAKWLDPSFPLDACVEAVREAKARGKAAEELREAKAQELRKAREAENLSYLRQKIEQLVRVYACWFEPKAR